MKLVADRALVRLLALLDSAHVVHEEGGLLLWCESEEVWVQSLQVHDQILQDFVDSAQLLFQFRVRSSFILYCRFGRHVLECKVIRSVRGCYGVHRLSLCRCNEAHLV